MVGFAKHFNNNDDIIRVINEDCTGRKIMRKTANANDAESIREIFTAVIQKYGLKLKVIEADNVDSLSFLQPDEEFNW